MSKLNPQNTKEQTATPEEIFGELFGGKITKGGYMNFDNYQSPKPNFDLPPINTNPDLTKFKQ
jgi:hypothetical protein